MARRLSSSSSFSSSSIDDDGCRSRAVAAAEAVAGWTPFIPSLRTTSSSWSKNDIGGDRFIPVRLPGYPCFFLNTKKPVADDDDAAAADISPSRLAYRRALADAVLRDRVFTYRVRPVVRKGPMEEELQPVALPKPRKKTWRVPKAPLETLELPDIQDDFYLNLLDWGSTDVLAVALGETVYLWDNSKRSSSVLGSESEDSFSFPITSVGWAPDGRRIAVGLDSSQLQVWNSVSGQVLRALSHVHGGGRVTSLAWKDDNVLATGGFDGCILLHDLRLWSSVVQTFSGHTRDVCGLKWSASGQQLASGGDDDLLHIWDVTSTNDQNQWLFRMRDHTSTVKALAWCPFQSNLLASGGGLNDCCIKFWNTSTGHLLNSVDTGSQVCSLQWSRHRSQLISSHGVPHNKLIVWNYPSMANAGDLRGHQRRALFTAQSPDGYTVASASADESLVFWQFFVDFEVPKPKVAKSSSGPFSSFSSSHIR